MEVLVWYVMLHEVHSCCCSLSNRRSLMYGVLGYGLLGVSVLFGAFILPRFLILCARLWSIIFPVCPPVFPVCIYGLISL